MTSISRCSISFIPSEILKQHYVAGVEADASLSIVYYLKVLVV